MYGPASRGTTPTSSAATAARTQQQQNDEQPPPTKFGGTTTMSSLAKPTTANAAPTTAAAPAVDHKPTTTNFASSTRLRLNMPNSLARPGHKPDAAAAATAAASPAAGASSTVDSNQQQSTKLFDTIVIPPVHAPNTFHDAVTNIREKLHIPTNLGIKSIQAAIAEQQAKRKKKAAKKGPKLPFKEMLKQAALRQYRRWFKPAELIFYLGQRENSAFPFRLDDNKTTYTYAWRELFHVYAGIAGIGFSLAWWFLTLAPQSGLSPNEDNFDAVSMQTFLPLLLALFCVWLIVGEIIPKRVVIDTSDHTVHLYRFGMHCCAARYETSFVRLRRALGSADEMRFNLVFGARNFPECFISGKTKNARVMRTIGRNLAKHLHVNYFDFSDLSIYHIPRMPHFVADPEWTEEMLCLVQIMKQHQQELDEVRRGSPPPPSDSANGDSGGTQCNVSPAFQTSSVCLNIHAPHVEPETIIKDETSSQTVFSTGNDGPITIIGGEQQVTIGRTSVKHRPQMLSQPRHIATSIKRPTNFAHPVLPSDAVSRPNVKDSLESLSKMVVDSTPSKPSTSAADVEQPAASGGVPPDSNIGGKSTIIVVDEKKKKKFWR